MSSGFLGWFTSQDDMLNTSFCLICHNKS